MLNAATLKPVVFFREAKTELTKVSWPTRKEAMRLTGIVIAVSVGVGLYIGALDFIFTKLVGIILNK
jgi:preprotein translocase subunit SecE